MVPTDAPRVPDTTRHSNNRLGFVLALIISVSFGIAFVAHRILFHTVFQ
ncbi:MAG: hypothetical protein VKP72_01395 [bacterium]|jgi:hypothetical protein|nr:hypothetical protein [bacterium]